MQHEAPARRRIVNNMLTITIDPARLGTADSLAAEVARVVDWVRASPAAAGHDGVRVAGEPELAARRARADGVPVDAQTWRQLEAAAEALGLGAAVWRRLSGLPATG